MLSEHNFFSQNILRKNHWKLHTISSMARLIDMFTKLELINSEYLVASWSWFMKLLSKGIDLADINEMSVKQV